MALNTNFNINPYNDDYDEVKKYLRLLFKPGTAVQARELTQIQSLLQNQVEKFGNHIFQNGSIVDGGQFFLQEATFLKLDASYLGVDIDVEEFAGKTILSVDETKRAEVIRVYDFEEGTGDPKTLLVKQLFGETFVSGEVIKTREDSPFFASISTSGVGTGQIFSVNEGVFYYDGFFIRNDPQTVATSKYSSTTANVRIGFEIEELIVNNNSDTSLLDPAQFSSNYQAPGADRYKIDLVLATRTLDSIDDERFIELARVEDGIITTQNQYPIYSVLEDTLARRTFDESGNYVVRPFRVSLQTNEANTAQTDITISPGKAYVYGYEFSTNGPTTLTVDKPRTTEFVENKRLPADYGNFVYTTNHFGSFPINSLSTVDLHCVNVASINNTSTSAIANTKIGTTRIKSIAFDTSSNVSNSSTYQYQTFLFDISVGSITGIVDGANSNSSFISISDDQPYTTVADAYRGAKLRITSGLGSSESAKNIIGFNAANQTLQVSPAFTEIPDSSSTFSIDFEFNDTSSLANFSSTTLITGANIAPRSIDLATPFNDVILTDSSSEPLIFRLGEEYVAQNTITDMSFAYKRLYQSQSFSSSESPSLSLGTSESLASGATTVSRTQNYYITVQTSGTSPYSIGDVIPADKFTVDTGTNRITVESGNNMVANIVSTINVSTATRKNKTYITGNTTIQVSGGTDVFGNTAVISHPANCQTKIATTFIGRTPGSVQSLFVSDVVRINKIIDFEGNAVTVANSSIATDVTNKYTFDNGQRDSYYDHSSIKLKIDTPPPVGPIVVFYDRFTSTGAGFFTVDSYSGINYEEIYSYSSAKNNSEFNLRDCLDFRPVRADATAGSGSTVVFNVDASTTGPKIPQYGSDIVLDFEYYLPRIDKVVLDKTRQFEIVKGIPSINPIQPRDTTTGMTLFILNYSPYVSSVRDVNIQQVNHRRYTMRDIGNIEKRVENLEYYTALSLLEQETITKQDLTILDSQNLPRFKNGILVDSFKGHSVADVTNADYKASIDPLNKEVRPSFVISAHKLSFDGANSSNFSLTGPLATAEASSISFIDQPKASRALNVNPFNVINFLGKIRLSPSSDIWVDTERQPEVLINVGGDRDAWELIVQNTPFQLEWNNWNTIWTGVSTNVTQGWQGNQLVQTSTNTVTQNQTRTGILSQVVPETIVQSIGDRVVDVSIIPFMRSINVLFVGTDFKPSTTLYPFFDGVFVEQFVGNRVNKIYLANNNIGFNTNLSNPEVIQIRNKDTNTTNATAIVAHTSNNIVYITNVNPTTELNFANVEIVSDQTSLTYDVVKIEHFGGVTEAATTNTITLRLDASGASNTGEYVGSVIFIPQGPGFGQQRTITNYNPTTRVATVSPNWTTIPVASESFYSIGRAKSDESGSVVGIFTIPNGIFRIGEKLFRLIDNTTGDIPSSSTNGDASFFAQGLLQNTQETILSTTVPTIQRTSVNDNRVINDTTSSIRVLQTVTWSDPLAQTFLVSPQQYPEGLFLSKLRFCFKTKDDVIPVTLQIRPTVNGFPSSSVVYPFSTVNLTPDKVNVTDSPNLDDPTKYTEFVFESPVYIQPGEHSFILLANSNKYEVFVAEMAALDLVENRQISEQPYGGSLFLSQNGSTWTPDQNLDMMFRMFRTTYDTNPVTLQFLIDTPQTDIDFNTIELITSDVVIANTALEYRFNSEIKSGGFAGLEPVTSLDNYEITSSERTLKTATGNTTFSLQTTMRTNNSAVSPMIDISRMGLLAIENRINNLGLSNSGIVIANTGSGYANSNDVIVTISGGNGSGATAVANVVANTIDAVYIVDSGSGYTTTPTITITPGSGGGANASILYTGETSSSGGNSLAKYITRRVTLADGFDSGDLRVYLTANKRSGTNIHVYFKILSSSDPDLFDEKPYQLMTQVGNANYISLNESDYRELLFAPGENGVPSNSVSYVSGDTAYSSFRTFAIKIVMSSQTTAIVPKIRDLRAIALPAG